MTHSKEIIVKKFAQTSFRLDDPIPLDEEIKEFIYEINKCPGIITTNSCAGHDKFESGASYDFVSHPYLAFLLSSAAWDVFWLKAAPQIACRCLVHIQIIDEHEKTAIILGAHFEDKRIFWTAVKNAFRAYLTNSFTNNNQDK